MKILVVEDDAIQRDMLTRLLASQGHLAEAASDGLEALRKLRFGRFDTVLLDHGLPEIDGMAAARLIADLTRETGRPRIVGLSITPERFRDPAAAAEGVFDAILAKPWQPQELLDTLRAVATRHPARPEEAEPAWMAPLIRPPRPAPGDAAGQAAGPARILVVDDDPVVRGLIEAALLAEGFAVDTADDGLAAFRRIARTPYRAVVLDIMMPGIDGLAAARLAFALLSGADRPRLIALTSTPDYLRDREAGSPSLFDAVLPKTGDAACLVAALRDSLEYRRRRMPLAPISLADVAALATLLDRRPAPLPQDLPA